MDAFEGDLNKTPRGESVRVPDSKCMKCGIELGIATAIGDGDAQACRDSVSVCGYCGNIAVFTKERTLRAPTKEELEEVRALPDYQKAIRLIEMVKQRSERQQPGIGPWRLPQTPT